MRAGKVLRKIRRSRGLSQARVAELTQGGPRPVTSHKISHIELGHQQQLAPDVARALAEAIGMTPEEWAELEAAMGLDAIPEPAPPSTAELMEKIQEVHGHLHRHLQRLDQRSYEIMALLHELGGQLSEILRELDAIRLRLGMPPSDNRP